MQELIEEFLGCSRFAVAGSFRSPAKYAYQIAADLLDRGKEVFPVNPRGGTVLALTCYRSLLDIEEKIDVLSVVTPPSATEHLVRECSDKGITRVWMQPGAESPEAIAYCSSNGIKVISGACLLLNR